MELRQLAYLVAVVEEASFTGAAHRVHVAQPGISAQIRRLEAELGEPLLDRSTRQVRPTAAGEAVLPYARAAIAAADGARAAVGELTGLLRGELSVGVVSGLSTAEVDLPAFLAAYHREHPAVRISVVATGSEELLAGLRAGHVDLGVIGIGESAPPGVDTHLIAAARLVAAVRHDDPLAARDTITLKALVQRELISLPRGTGLRTALDQACADAGLTPQIAFEAADPPFLLRLAAEGLGVGIAPGGVAAADPGVHAVAITQPVLAARLALAWRSQAPASPATRALIGRAREAFPPRATP